MEGTSWECITVSTFWRPRVHVSPMAPHPMRPALTIGRSPVFCLLLAAVPVAQLTVGWATGPRSSRCAVASVLKRGCIVAVPSLFFRHHPRLHMIVRSAYCKHIYTYHGTCALRERSGDALARSLDASLACAPAPPVPRLATRVCAQRAHVPPGLPRTSSRGARGI